MLARMTESLARRERAALCDLAVEVGADAPTLCEGWTASDLVAHLLVRERNPIASLGNVLESMAPRAEAAMAQRQARGYDAMVATLRTPPAPLRVLPFVDRMMNGFEYLVHHEDLRRGAEGWQPRTLDPADVDALWSQLGRGAAFFGRKLPSPTVLRRSDTGATAVVRKGTAPVTISGEVVELVLFMFGRSATVGLEFDGPEAAVAAVRAADLGA
jgi:uncharacterized protein (TIGR03085 family)